MWRAAMLSASAARPSTLAAASAASLSSATATAARVASCSVSRSAFPALRVVPSFLSSRVTRPALVLPSARQLAAAFSSAASGDKGAASKATASATASTETQPPSRAAYSTVPPEGVTLGSFTPSLPDVKPVPPPPYTCADGVWIPPTEIGPDLCVDPLGHDRGVAYWLFACAGLVFGMVVLGGLTRLTKSGLSMVEWKPTTFIPPRTEEEWSAEFAKYQLFPEYQRVNNQMTLDEFKFIYRMEFYHRLLGRTLGIAFAVPALYFGARGRINRRLGARLGLAFAAGGTQGAIGWWMVKSGLEQPHEGKSGAVHVSPYRLATHLISAFAIYALLFSTALRVLPVRQFRSALWSNSMGGRAVRELFVSTPVRRLRTLVGGTTALVGLTVVSGAFVAGNEAGLVYNEFPLMGGSVWPSDMINPYLSPAWRNAFENSTMVQWNHRVLALSTAALVLYTFARTRGMRTSSAVQALCQYPDVSVRVARIGRAAHALAGMVAVQVGLGISTLLLYVPVSLATAHQAGSMLLLTFSLALWNTLRNPFIGFKGALPAGAADAVSVGLRQQLLSGLRDLLRGRLHRGSLGAALVLALAAALGLSLTQLGDVLGDAKASVPQQLQAASIEDKKVEQQQQMVVAKKAESK